jgi:hypothetical protein
MQEPKRPDSQARPVDPKGPVIREKNQYGVHIILVPLDPVLKEMHVDKLASGDVDTVTLTQVEKHVGQPQPTDIVVFANEPWHYAGPPGQKHLRAHPNVHIQFPETVLVLSVGDQDQAVWWSEQSFDITAIGLAGPAHANPHFAEATTPPPPYPFNLPVTRLEQNLQGQDIYVARAAPPIPGTEHHMYKIEFTIGTDTIDPDMYCAP